MANTTDNTNPIHEDGGATSARMSITSLMNADDVQASGDVDQVAQQPVVTNGSPGTSPNPEAAPFVPAEKPVIRGIRSPEDFMAHWRAMQARSHAIRITVPQRRISFKDLPEGMTISDVLCLVHGGAVDRAWMADENMAIVQFCDDNDCKEYFDAYNAGIRVDGNHVITIEKPQGTDQVMLALKEKIEAGGSRLVRVSGVPGDKTFQDLRDIVTGFDMDHLLWRVENDQPGTVYVFLANIIHAWDLKKQLEADPAWKTCEIDFLPDPCKVATGFHENTVPSRMSSAVANDA